MILVVDDDKKIVELIERILTKEGYTVRTAADGVEAYKHIKAPDCTCMLLDINMPKINGAELLMLMETEGIKVPTIVMAGFSDFEKKELKQFANVVEFLKKPFEIQQMLSAIQNHARVPAKP